MGLRDSQGLGALLLFLVVYVAIIVILAATAVTLFAKGRYIWALLPGGGCGYLVYRAVQAYRWE